jgi:hypothetical protein
MPLVPYVPFIDVNLISLSNWAKFRNFHGYRNRIRVIITYVLLGEKFSAEPEFRRIIQKIKQKIILQAPESINV